MLAGKIGHSIIEYKPIRTKIVQRINELLGIKGEPLSITLKEDYDEGYSGWKCVQYCREQIPKDQWKKEWFKSYKFKN